jgi:protein CrcB
MGTTLSARRRILAVFAGGFCGTIARALLSMLIQSHLGNTWPYDILSINLTGAFLLAFFTTLADATFLIGPTRRLFINVGFLGAYTTFSSLALGDILQFEKGHWFPGLLYLVLSIAGGILAILLGELLGQACVKRTRSHNTPASTAPLPSLSTKPPPSSSRDTR